MVSASFSEEPPKAPSVKNGSCPDELHGVTWMKHGSHCYLPVSQLMTWHEARLYCARYGSTATLVSIHSENENNFVHDNMPGSFSWTRSGWIGLYRHTKGNAFYLINLLSWWTWPQFYGANVAHCCDRKTHFHHRVKYLRSLSISCRQIELGHHQPWHGSISPAIDLCCDENH